MTFRRVVIIGALTLAVLTCVGAALTLAMYTTARNADAAMAAMRAVDETAKQTGANVCIAGIANIGSCTIEQRQERTTQDDSSETEELAVVLLTGLLGAGVFLAFTFVARVIEGPR